MRIADSFVACRGGPSDPSADRPEDRHRSSCHMGMRGVREFPQRVDDAFEPTARNATESNSSPDVTPLADASAMRVAFLCGIAVGVPLGLLLATLIHRAADTARLPLAGVLDGWAVVRDDETLLCESPVIFVRAKQIECP